MDPVQRLGKKLGQGKSDIELRDAKKTKTQRSQRLPYKKISVTAAALRFQLGARQVQVIAAKDARAASSVAAMSLSLCAAETKPASNAEGAR